MIEAAIVCAALAAAILVYALVGPRRPRVPLERRRPGQPPEPGFLEAGTALATSLVARVMHRRGTPAGSSTLELAAIRMRPQDFVFLVLVGSLVGLAAGLVLGNVFLALLFTAAPPIAARVWLSLRISRRQKAFSDQLDDSLTLMASNLRAGHSLAQALSSVAREAESPTAEEFSRVVNETRVGRDLVDALQDTAARMESEDFVWVAQAIAINHQVGGNLAEVLDQVANTIRERNEIRRMVSALSAEGRLSAVILMALPFVVMAFLLLTNPTYLAPLVSGGLLGFAILGAGVVMLVIGGIWLSKTVTIKF